MSIRDTLLALVERQTVKVDEGVYVRTWTAAERGTLMSGIRDKPGEYYARIVALSACDQSGNPLFTDADIPTLAQSTSPLIPRIADCAVDLNGLGTDTHSIAKKH